MNNRQGLSLQELYTATNRLDQMGIEGYQIRKQYVDPLRQIEKRQFLKRKKGEKNRKRVTKRGSYIEDEEKLHMSVPGPGQYPTVSHWGQSSKLKVRYADKKTYIDDIIKYQKKWKNPAPGQYNTFKSLKEMDKAKKELAAKKLHYQDRINFLDQVQVQSSHNPGAGNYNPRDRIKTQYSKIKTKPEDWRKKHQEFSKKKPPKSPEMGSYSPLPADFKLFEHLKQTKKSKSMMDKLQRFKTAPTGSGIPPAKYTVLQQWRGKDKKKIQRHGMEALSKTTYKSVYYH